MAGWVGCISRASRIGLADFVLLRNWDALVFADRDGREHCRAGAAIDAAGSEFVVRMGTAHRFGSGGAAEQIKQKNGEGDKAQSFGDREI